MAGELPTRTFFDFTAAFYRLRESGSTLLLHFIPAFEHFGAVEGVAQGALELDPGGGLAGLGGHGAFVDFDRGEGFLLGASRFGEVSGGSGEGVKRCAGFGEGFCFGKLGGGEFFNFRLPGIGFGKSAIQIGQDRWELFGRLIKVIYIIGGEACRNL